MYRSVTVRKLVNGWLLTYEPWLQHLPPREVYLTTKEMDVSKHLVAEVFTYDEAAAMSREKPEPKKTTKKKQVEDDDEL